MIIKAKRLHPDARIPAKSRPDDAAWDLACVYPCVLAPGWVEEIDIKIAVEIPRGFFGKILGRSGLARKGIGIIGGCIDSNYRGSLVVILANHGPKLHRFEAGDRVAQLVVLPVPQLEIVEADELNPSERGAAGFGSSGS